MSAVWSSFKRTANNPRRFDKPWQLMTGYGNIAETKQDGSWVKYVFSLMAEKKSSCAQPLEWPFELGFTEQIPKVLDDNSEHFPAFWETLFGSERAKKRPEIYFRPKSFRTIFEKRTPIYSLAAPLSGLAKSIYYCVRLDYQPLPRVSEPRRAPQLCDGLLWTWGRRAARSYKEMIVIVHTQTINLGFKKYRKFFQNLRFQLLTCASYRISLS